MSSPQALIADAILKLKDRAPGSTAISIKKHIQANMPAGEEWMNSVFLSALKKMVADGDLLQADECYMFSEKFLANGKKMSASDDGKEDAKKAADKYVPRPWESDDDFSPELRIKKRVFLPRSELGDLVDEYIYFALSGAEDQCLYGGEVQDEIKKLIKRDGKASVVPFFEPLDVSYFRTLTYFQDGQHRSDNYGLHVDMKGGIVHSGSAVEQIEAFHKYFKEHGGRYMGHKSQGGDNISEFAWLIKRLKKAMNG